MLPVTDVEFPGHAWHVSIAVAFTAPEYVLGRHDVHHEEPVTSLYLPSWHAEQGA